MATGPWWQRPAGEGALVYPHETVRRPEPGRCGWRRRNRPPADDAFPSVARYGVDDDGPTTTRAAAWRPPREASRETPLQGLRRPGRQSRGAAAGRSVEEGRSGRVGSGCRRGRRQPRHHGWRDLRADGTVGQRQVDALEAAQPV